MTEELSKQYNPKETEEKWYSIWEESNFFPAKVSAEKPPYCIVIPPPNVTGILHMGHALNNTIQDILIRYKRMKGFSSLWMPGTDHAGIATQNVVEKSIAKQGLKRQDLGREKFIEQVWGWKEEYGSTIIRQLKKLGASCDWSRERFTMDEAYSRSVRTAFVMLWKKGLIYQGDKVINWCPRCQTALSDEEAAHREINGVLYYIKYPLKESTVHSAQCTNKTIDYSTLSTIDYVTVATTRPETMLGDTAVAVNPKDKRYKEYIGKTLIIPLINRQIKIIADGVVDMRFGSGAVKVTPAHDPNDYYLGKKHGLEFINLMHPDGRMNSSAGKFSGLDRFKAREAILEELKEIGLLEKIQEHKLSVGHCYRCHTVVEPYLSKQWFVKMKPLAKPAIAAVKRGKIKFYPQRWTKVYLNWMENIQDWCISRQIWWGHRIPIWYCSNCKQEAIACIDPPTKCRVCHSNSLYQDKDVLDTWFSSWLWPFAVFGWPFASQKSIVDSRQSIEKTKTMGYGLWAMDKTDLDYFYPTSVLVTAPEIIFFWVARMIMAGLEFKKNVPFKDVYIHGTVRDIEGKKMSKSLGNVIDPLEVIAEYGADALRFSLVSITAQGQDVYLSKERFEQGRNFANKIWNASRFILMNLKPENINVDLCAFFKNEELDIANRWILSRFYSTLEKTEKYLAEYKFNEAASGLYSFFWREFCDWYLELIKPQIGQKSTQVVMYKVLEKTLRLIHPFMPFISEEIWQRLSRSSSPRVLESSSEPANPRTREPANSIMMHSWPHLQPNLISPHDESQMRIAFDIINAIRNMRAEMEVGPASRIKIKLSVSNIATGKTIAALSGYIENLAKLDALSITESYHPQGNEFACLLKDMHIVMPLGGIVDVAEQIKKNEVKIDKIRSEIKNKEAVLANKAFLSRAPKEIVDSEKAKLQDMHEQAIKLEVIKNGLR